MPWNMDVMNPFGKMLIHHLRDRRGRNAKAQSKDTQAEEKQLPSYLSMAAGSAENSFPPCYEVVLEMSSNSKIPVVALANSNVCMYVVCVSGVCFDTDIAF